MLIHGMMKLQETTKLYLI